ncbi:conserved protein, unknown function [Hepatocystis sp. ex Piliocolobus tephrosceles]|nr:conserved protein, unknown function [Hepatocystis sp. ex Piliocolobus tephrosceles]
MNLFYILYFIFYLFFFFQKNVAKKVENNGIFFKGLNFFTKSDFQNKVIKNEKVFIKNCKKKNGINCVHPYCSIIDNVKKNITSFFKRKKDVIENIKNLYNKESLWFVTGYCQNLFHKNSFFNIVGLEVIKEVDPRKFIFTSSKKNNSDNLLGKNNNYELRNMYKVKRYVIFYKNSKSSFDKKSENSFDKKSENSSDKKSENSSDKKGITNTIINKKNNDGMKKNFIMCQYVYFILHIHDKKNNKFYILSNSINDNNTHGLYEINELKKDQLPNMLNNNILNKNKLKELTIISLINKNEKLNDISDNNIYINNFINAPGYGNIINNNNTLFNSYIKKVFNFCNNSGLLFDHNTSFGKQSNPYIFLIYGNDNFIFKDKSYYEHFINFFMKRRTVHNFCENIFKNNKGYKLCIRSDLQDKPSYLIKYTKLKKKKFEKLYKYITNTYYKNDHNYIFNDINSNSFFSYTKILFEKCKNDYMLEKKKKFTDNDNTVQKSIYINIGNNNYSMDQDISVLKNNNETLLFTIAKSFLNNLITSIYI